MTEAIGHHVILDMFGVDPTLLSDELFIHNAMVEAATKSGATILGHHLHHFGEGYGVTGFLVLAESHISVHTWPEKDGLATFDLFMCGNCDPLDGADKLVFIFQPKKVKLTDIPRGEE